MTIAYWCVLAAAVVTYGVGVVSKSGGGYDNRNPRPHMETQRGWRQRAYWAHLNGLEAFPLFAAAVLIAQLTQAPQTRIDTLALAFVGLRIIYSLLYITDRPTLRSLSWGLGFFCCIGLFVAGA